MPSMLHDVERPRKVDSPKVSAKVVQLAGQLGFPALGRQAMGKGPPRSGPFPHPRHSEASVRTCSHGLCRVADTTTALSVVPGRCRPPGLRPCRLRARSRPPHDELQPRMGQV